MKSKVKSILVLLLGILILTTILFTNQVKAVVVEEEPEGIWVYLDIFSPEGTSMQYIPPESGGYGFIFNNAIDYTNCTYEMSGLYSYYGETLQTDLGIFTFKEKIASSRFNEETMEKEECFEYIYTAPVDKTKMVTNSGKWYSFKAINQETNQEETLSCLVEFYELKLKETSNLIVNDTYIIKNGEYIVNGESIGYFEKNYDKGCYWGNLNR